MSRLMFGLTQASTPQSVSIGWGMCCIVSVVRARRPCTAVCPRALLCGGVAVRCPGALVSSFGCRAPDIPKVCTAAHTALRAPSKKARCSAAGVCFDPPSPPFPLPPPPPSRLPSPAAHVPFPCSHQEASRSEQQLPRSLQDVLATLKQNPGKQVLCLQPSFSRVLWAVWVGTFWDGAPVFDH